MKIVFTFAILNPFMPLVSFYSPWKHQKNKGFLMFSGGIEWNKWNELNKVIRKQWRLVGYEELIQVIAKLEIEKKIPKKFCCYPWWIRCIVPENLEIKETPLDQIEGQRGRLFYSTENIGNVFEDVIKLLNGSRTLFEK